MITGAVRLTRRHLLAAGALVAAAGVGGPAGLAWHWWDQPPAAGHTLLSADEVAFLDAFAEALFPAGGEPALGGREAQVARFVEVVWGALEPFQQKLLRESLHGLDHLARLDGGAPLSRLAPEAAQDVVAGWLAHPRVELRGLVTSLHVFVGMAWATHPEVAPSFARHFRCGFGR